MNLLTGKELEDFIEQKPRFYVGSMETLGGDVKAVRCDTEDCTFWRRFVDFEDPAQQDRLLRRLDEHERLHEEEGT